MSGTVPSLTIVCMAISCAVSFCLPVILLLYFRKKKGADFLPFFIGCAVMLVFALILEAAVHTVVLATPAGAFIQDHLWLYALYGGFMAGLFEESGRFIAFKTALRKKQNNDANALMYGAGHGGMEAFIILGITSINNILYSVLVNTGRTSVLTGPLSGEMLTQAEGAVQALITTPSWHFLLGSVERILAIIVQISFSVLVWFAAKEKKRVYLYPIAILLHLIVDAAAAILAGKNVSLVLVEALIAAFAVISVLIAGKTWELHAAAPGTHPSH